MTVTDSAVRLLSALGVTEALIEKAEHTFLNTPVAPNIQLPFATFRIEIERTPIWKCIFCQQTNSRVFQGYMLFSYSALVELSVHCECRLHQTQFNILNVERDVSPLKTSNNGLIFRYNKDVIQAIDRITRGDDVSFGHYRSVYDPILATLFGGEDGKICYHELGQDFFVRLADVKSYLLGSSRTYADIEQRVENVDYLSESSLMRLFEMPEDAFPEKLTIFVRASMGTGKSTFVAKVAEIVARRNLCASNAHHGLMTVLSGTTAQTDASYATFIKSGLPIIHYKDHKNDKARINPIILKQEAEKRTPLQLSSKRYTGYEDYSFKTLNDKAVFSLIINSLAENVITATPERRLIFAHTKMLYFDETADGLQCGLFAPYMAKYERIYVEALHHLIRNCNIVIFTYAQLADYHAQFAARLRPDSRNIFLDVPTPERLRRVMYVAKYDRQRTIQYLAKLASTGVKLFITTDSKDQVAEKLAAILRDPSHDFTLNGYKVQCYSADTDQGKKSEDFRNPNEAWSMCDVIITTPTCRTGVDFTHQHFDYAVVVNTNKVVSGIDLLQMVSRARQLQSKTVVSFLTSSKLVDESSFVERPVAVDDDVIHCATANELLKAATLCGYPEYVDLEREFLLRRDMLVNNHTECFLAMAVHSNYELRFIATPFNVTENAVAEQSIEHDVHKLLVTDAKEQLDLLWIETAPDADLENRQKAFNSETELRAIYINRLFRYFHLDHYLHADLATDENYRSLIIKYRSTYNRSQLENKLLVLYKFACEPIDRVTEESYKRATKRFQDTNKINIAEYKNSLVAVLCHLTTLDFGDYAFLDSAFTTYDTMFPSVLAYPYSTKRKHLQEGTLRETYPEVNAYFVDVQTVETLCRVFDVGAGFKTRYKGEVAQNDLQYSTLAELVVWAFNRLGVDFKKNRNANVKIGNPVDAVLSFDVAGPSLCALEFFFVQYFHPDTILFDGNDVCIYDRFDPNTVWALFTLYQRLVAEPHWALVHKASMSLLRDKLLEWKAALPQRKQLLFTRQFNQADIGEKRKRK
jgi:hypothetical protein